MRQPPRRRQSSNSHCRRSMEHSATRLPQSTLPRLLAGSSSLPLLAAERRARELCGIKDEYYGGNELSMHEDILYCSNHAFSTPNLFPLRTSHDVPFPLRSVVAYNGHVAEGG